MTFTHHFTDARRPVISFEVFPPKTDAGMKALKRVVPGLIDMGPSFMTVTYGALGSTRERTLEIASLLKNHYALETACHLTCVGSSRAELDRILHDIREEKIENIVALRGDPPQGESEFVPPPDGYAHGNELVEHIRRFEQEQGGHRFGVAVAGYPEKHLEAPDLATDLANLKRKVDAGADVVITQLFYDNAHFFEFDRRARDLGIEAPIVPGLLPILSAAQIRRITSLCGATLPAALHQQLDEASDDNDQAEEVGVRHCVSQATELLRKGVPGIHFYVLNQSRHMQRIMDELRPVVQQLRDQGSGVGGQGSG